MKIYVASSWRNTYQPLVVGRLRVEGHAVYDFKNPPSRAGFAWSQIDENWENWTQEEYLAALQHPIAQAGFSSDFDHMKWADVCVCVLPCGRSAHLELGWSVGAGKKTALLLDVDSEPELMVNMVDFIGRDMDEIVEWLK